MTKKATVKSEVKEVTKASFINTIKDCFAKFIELGKIESVLASAIEQKKAVKLELKKIVSVLKLEVKALKLSRASVGKELESMRDAFILAYGDNSKVKSGKTTVSAESFSSWKKNTLNALFPESKAKEETKETDKGETEEKAEKLSMSEKQIIDLSKAIDDLLEKAGLKDNQKASFLKQLAIGYKG